MAFASSNSLYPLLDPRHEPLHPAHHLRKTALLHPFHHLAHLLELVEQAIDFLHRHTGRPPRCAFYASLALIGKETRASPEQWRKANKNPAKGIAPRGVGTKPSLRMRSDGVSTTA